MVATVLYRHAGQPDISGHTNPFTDVPEGKWYTDAAIWAAENGIAEGKGGGRFIPVENISRQQLARMFFNYYEFLGEGPVGAWMIHVDFEDVEEIADWAMTAVVYCYMRGVITGKPGNMFDPRGTATRAEFATMLLRFMESVDNSDSNPAPHSGPGAAAVDAYYDRRAMEEAERALAGES